MLHTDICCRTPMTFGIFSYITDELFSIIYSVIAINIEGSIIFNNGEIGSFSSANKIRDIVIN